MSAQTAHMQLINLSMVGDAVARLQAAEKYLEDYRTSKSVPAAESSVLQLRKALESIAFASVGRTKQNTKHSVPKLAINRATRRITTPAKSSAP